MSYKIIHYINQFFGGIGGEEKADHKPEVREGIVGPGLPLNQSLKGQAEVVATVICGDNYCVCNPEAVGKLIIDTIAKYKADALVAGPAFNAGRYGMACGLAVSTAAAKGIPTLTAMYPENPGVDLYKTNTFILPTADSASGMKQAVLAMGAFLLKLLSGQPLNGPEAEGYIERGVRMNTFYGEIGAERAVKMLLKKIKGEDFTTEYKMPVFDRVTPRPAIKDMGHTTIALVTSGGIVPKGNPDHIAASSARNYGVYEIDGVDDLTSDTYQTAHGGYDQTYANQDSDRVLPVDVLREMEKNGRIGKLFHTYFSTVGNGTAVSSAKKWGQEIGIKLKNEGVQAVILTST
jgi:glycine reductase